MVFAGMNLLHHPANPRAVTPYYYEQVFCHKTDLLVGAHYLDVGEPLPVRTYFVLALDDQQPPRSRRTRCASTPASSYKDRTAS